MKKVVLLSIALVGSIGLSGCHIAKLANINNDLQKQIDEDRKKNQETLNQLQKSLEQGGQPGSIRISGIVVKDDSQTDVRITVITKGGLGKDGTEATVIENKKPSLFSKSESINSRQDQEKSLIAIGCDEKLVSDYAKERSLEVQKMPEPLFKDRMTLYAKTLVLCGRLDELKYQYITLNSDELILNDVAYTKVGMMGWINLNTNKLLLLGSNKIEAKGLDSSPALSLTPSISLNVVKEISSDESGKLLLKSTGSNYKEESK